MNVVLIPAYQPDEKLNRLIDNLQEVGLHEIVVINDGSSSACLPFFEKAIVQGCQIVTHEQNKGKGAAIKTGIQWVLKNLPSCSGVVTCDADGQHLAEDILHVSKMLDQENESLIIGSRDFSQKNVPAKSRFGNRFSSFYFKVSTGVTCKDTQTGLRGFGPSLFPMALEIKQDRYDYEMTFLTNAAKEGIAFVSVPIQTVYLDHNASSHFRPLLDSYRIYKEPLKFAISSLISAATDLTIFTIMTHLLEGHIVKLVFLATLVARIASGILNFTLNRVWSFQNYSSLLKQFRRYALLYVVQFGLSVAFVSLLAFLPTSLTVVKILVDGILFVGSYFIQKHWVFKHHPHETKQS